LDFGLTEPAKKFLPQRRKGRQVRREEFNHKEGIERKEIFYVNFAVNNFSRRLRAPFASLACLAGEKSESANMS
jgi:hypothetical protein